MKIDFLYQEKFENRHNNSNVADRKAMLETIGVDSIETLINQTDFGNSTERITGC